MNGTNNDRFANVESVETMSEFDREIEAYRLETIAHMESTNYGPTIADGLFSELDDHLMNTFTLKRNGKTRTIASVFGTKKAESKKVENADSELNLRYFLFAKMLANVATNANAKIVSPEKFNEIVKGSE